MNISEINAIDTDKSTKQLSKGLTNENDKSFKTILKNVLKSANNLQNNYEEMTYRSIIGEDVDLHDIVIAGEKAKLSLELTLQIRNKALEAYQEIMRMQV